MNRPQVGNWCQLFSKDHPFSETNNISGFAGNFGTPNNMQKTNIFPKHIPYRFPIDSL
jgi:hypothetical protein